MYTVNKDMKKNHIFYLIIGILVVTLVVGGFYVYKFRECVKKVSYEPPREQGETIGGFSGLRRVVGVADKGDYYSFDFGWQKFKTSDDAIRACIWK